MDNYFLEMRTIVTRVSVGYAVQDFFFISQNAKLQTP